MAVSRALRRLLQVRELQEEQCRLAMEAAINDLHRLEAALRGAGERERIGRRLIEASAHSGDLPDRLAGLEEVRTGARFALVLEPRVVAQQGVVEVRKQEFLEKRIERRQAETLIEETEARDAIEFGRRSQQTLDDWYSSKLFHRSPKRVRPDSGKRMFPAVQSSQSEPSVTPTES